MVSLLRLALRSWVVRRSPPFFEYHTKPKGHKGPRICARPLRRS